MRTLELTLTFPFVCCALSSALASADGLPPVVTPDGGAGVGIHPATFSATLFAVVPMVVGALVAGTLPAPAGLCFSPPLAGVGIHPATLSATLFAVAVTVEGALAGTLPAGLSPPLAAAGFAGTAGSVTTGAAVGLGALPT